MMKNFRITWDREPDYFLLNLQEKLNMKKKDFGITGENL